MTWAEDVTRLNAKPLRAGEREPADRVISRFASSARGEAVLKETARTQATQEAP